MPEQRRAFPWPEWEVSELLGRGTYSYAGTNGYPGTYSYAGANSYAGTYGYSGVSCGCRTGLRWIFGD